MTLIIAYGYLGAILEGFDLISILNQLLKIYAMVFSPRNKKEKQVKI